MDELIRQLYDAIENDKEDTARELCSQIKELICSKPKDIRQYYYEDTLYGLISNFLRCESNTLLFNGCIIDIVYHLGRFGIKVSKEFIKALQWQGVEDVYLLIWGLTNNDANNTPISKLKLDEQNRAKLIKDSKTEGSTRTKPFDYWLTGAPNIKKSHLMQLHKRVDGQQCNIAVLELWDAQVKDGWIKNEKGKNGSIKHPSANAILSEFNILNLYGEKVDLGGINKAYREIIALYQNEKNK